MQRAAVGGRGRQRRRRVDRCARCDNHFERNRSPLATRCIARSVLLVLLFFAGWGCTREVAPPADDSPQGNSTLGSTPSGTETGAATPATDGKQPAIDRNAPADALESEVGEVKSTVCADRHGTLADELMRIDAGKDGWTTEVFYDVVKPQLKAITKLFAHPEQLDAVHLDKLVSADFACASLRPEPLVEVFRDRSMRVLRSDPVSARSAPVRNGGYRGHEGFKAAVIEMLSRFTTPEHVTTNTKIFRVELDGAKATATTLIDTDGPAAGSADSSPEKSPRGVQQNATWRCSFSQAADGKSWLLSSIEVEALEEVEYRGATSALGGKLFADCSEAVVGKNACWSNQFLYGTDHWRLRLESTLDIDSSGLLGLAVGDANGDGLDDLYVLESGGVPKRLLLQQADGTVRDVSREAGVDFLDRARAALFVDLDNDGDQDLVIGLSERVLLMENDGAGKFTKRGDLKTTPVPHTLTAIDYDGDGDLDLYSANYGNNQESFGDDNAPLPWYDASNGAPNAMFRNDGGWRFKDVTNEIGLDDNNFRYSFSAAWDDYDNDGDLDVYVANDFGRGNLYRNDNGRFHDVAAEAGVENFSPGMSAAWGDFNNDGLMDLYVGNMFSGAGNRITTQKQFKANSPESAIQGLRKFSRGNALFKNLGNGKFADVAAEANVALGRWAWSSVFVDLNNDGWQDIVVANGFITGQNPDDL